MVIKVLRWSARILVIVAILFMVMFSIDVFEMDRSFGEKIIGFLIHNIPALILTAILVVAWKKELAGGFLLIIAVIVLMLKFNAFTLNKGALVIFLPFLLAGILFIACQIADHHRISENKETDNVES
jgi:hypothetical protein